MISLEVWVKEVLDNQLSGEESHGQAVTSTLSVGRREVPELAWVDD
jgi:hypothetical protein